jgi:RNA polymerase sigma-70 factor (ECF subfamily)
MTASAPLAGIGPAPRKGAELQVTSEPLPPFDSLYPANLDFVLRTLRRLGVSGSAVEDAAQEVFLVVLRRADSFEGRGSVRSWLFGIARRVAKSHRRPRDRAEDELDALDEADFQSPESRAGDAELARALESLLGRLPREQREPFILVELEEMGVREAAAALEVNHNTLFSRLKLARRQVEVLAAALLGEGSEP